MKKYKLKKDFPGSKIGDVWLKPDNGFMSPEGSPIKMHEQLFEPFNDWFEDYEEPKGIQKIHKHGDDIVIRMGSEEEAEKAVEKLKAWKRLREKGFKFEWWTSQHDGNHIEFYIDEMEWDEDLDLLFGGEE